MLFKHCFGSSPNLLEGTRHKVGITTAKIFREGPYFDTNFKEHKVHKITNMWSFRIQCSSRLELKRTTLAKESFLGRKRVESHFEKYWDEHKVIDGQRKIITMKVGVRQMPLKVQSQSWLVGQQIQSHRSLYSESPIHRAGHLTVTFISAAVVWLNLFESG